MVKQLNNNLPTVSVIIATYNSIQTIQRCLFSIKTQQYPQDKIDILIADGGSTDKTLQVVEKFKAKILHIPSRLQNAEYNKGVAVRKATGELLLMIDHDNILPHEDWLMGMVKPLLENRGIVGVETLRYRYDPSLSLLDRYFALFGAGDPLAFYLKKADRLSYLYKTYNLLGDWKDLGAYYVVRFSKNHIPTLGANGFLVRRNILVKHALIDSSHFYHIDVNVDLINKGYNTFAFVKDDIIHLTGYKDISNFLYRRKLFMEQFHFKKYRLRRYSVFMPQDTFKLIVFIIYSVTFIRPAIDALRGYIKIHDIAWFLHPFLCFSLLSIYGFVTIKHVLFKYDQSIIKR